MNSDNQTAERETAPVYVQNRDIPFLAEIPCIMQEICQLEKQRDWQRDRMFSITQHLTAMPRGGGLPRGLEDGFAMLSEIDSRHEARCKEYVRHLRRAEKIMNEIESQTMRTFVMMKYIMDISDKEIRDELNMTRRGFDRARKAVESAPSMAQVKWQERYIIAMK